MKPVLFLDTSNPDKIKAALVYPTRVLSLELSFAKNHKGLIGAIEQLLKKNKVKLTDLGLIAAVIGPGPFSRIRSAVTTANALAFTLNIPLVGLRSGQSYDWKMINSKKKSKSLLPMYDKKPNITKPKKRKLIL
jgi:tRNA threonylcarbamoyl adenosine modification protein YeaZ